MAGTNSPRATKWTRRQTAEHAIGVDYAFAGWAVSLAGGGEASTERTDPSLGQRRRGARGVRRFERTLGRRLGGGDA